MTQADNTIYQASWLFTNCGPAQKMGGVEVTSEGRIVRVFSEAELQSIENKIVLEGFLIPGFVNAHCHLELSYAAARVERNCRINDFIDRLEFLKREIPQEQKIAAIPNAIELMIEEGIQAVGDICNTKDTAEIKKQFTAIQFRNFIEVYGINPEVASKKYQQATDLKSYFNNASIVPHAPYSLSNNLWDLLLGDQNSSDTLSIHLQESEEEREYFVDGKGSMRERFESWGLKTPDFIPYGKSSAHFVAEKLRGIQSKVLLVHMTHTDEDSLKVLQNLPDIHICLCPSSNMFIENRLPNLEVIRNSKIPLCLGTDSLASNDTLSILHEMKILQNHNANLALEDLIMWGSLNGAKALGFEEKLGSLEIGKTPGLLLIEDVDIERKKLLDWSWVNRIL